MVGWLNTFILRCERDGREGRVVKYLHIKVCEGGVVVGWLSTFILKCVRGGRVVDQLMLS